MRWVDFPLHPETPEEGRSLEDLFRGRDFTVAEAMTRLKKTADELGLPLGDRTMTYNSRRAQELGKWAEANGKGDEFHDAVFKAYFVDGFNIAQFDILTSIVSSVGLSPDEARSALDRGTYREAVDEDWALSRAMGITAVPTFVLGMRRAVGAQPYETLAMMLSQSGVPRRGAQT